MNIYKYTATIALCVVLVVALTLVGVDFLATPYISADSDTYRPWDDSFNEEIRAEIADRYTIDLNEYRHSETDKLLGYGLYYDGTFYLLDPDIHVKNFYWTTTSVVFHRETCHVGYILTDTNGKQAIIR